MDAFENRTKSAFGDSQPNLSTPNDSTQANATGDILSAGASAAAAAAAAAVTRATQHMLVPNARGQVVLPKGVSIDDIQISGNDLVITCPPSAPMAQI